MLRIYRLVLIPNKIGKHLLGKNYDKLKGKLKNDKKAS